MHALQQRPPGVFAGVRFVLTDMDETLTHQGRLAAATYHALEQLQQAGIRVIPVTAAPAGWCDQMARMWPVDGVIGENGGFFFRRDGQHGLARRFWHGEYTEAVMQALRDKRDDLRRRLPWATLSDDQPFRLTSLAFAREDDPARERELAAAMREAGLDVTVNNLWVLGWIGGYDKLAAARRVLEQEYAVGDALAQEVLAYSGDSINDAPMFAHYRHTLGVSTIRQCLEQLPKAPAWISDGPGGAGFIEFAHAILADRAAAPVPASPGELA
ncbi:MAG: Mannosyl-3-phosphoglycerate phosphatase [Herbaspirillum frisingense]|uniref:Mannosyl-3-phosphoglycerate phosphatase n=1 Tax=Herbaspirillum frisingense TaxID=92645 RepID=A0A7V8FVY9_9BURK|nr:MAG: Mannosyl-3-phosphoglycerate phosphatase [Herbaspirillum frisingense]